METVEVRWKDVDVAVKKWANRILKSFNFKIPFNLELTENHIIKDPVTIVGVTRGGITPAVLLFDSLRDYFVDLEVKMVDPFVDGTLAEFSKRHVIMVDDIYDTGATCNWFQEQALHSKVCGMMWFTVVDKRIQGSKNTWYVFPWETKEDEIGGRKQATVAILRSIGEDPLREGLKGTPTRVAKMWSELTVGYNQKPEDVLDTTFSSEKYDEMIILKDIRFFSTCEHHLLPFYGKVHFAYVPNQKVVGVSKIIRLIDIFSRRLQIQERMTMEIGKAFEKTVEPKGVGIVIEGMHLCTMLRGVKRENSVMKTSYLGGCFRKEAQTRGEFLKLIGS